jgi:hypothetical protein
VKRQIGVAQRFEVVGPVDFGRDVVGPAAFDGMPIGATANTGFRKAGEGL